MLPQLNWKEIEIYSQKILPELKGLFVDRIIIPQRQNFPFLKDEWEIRLSSRQNSAVLLMSARAQAPYFAWSPQAGHKASSQATRSSFLLLLSKTLKGAQLLSLEALPQDRVVIFWFSHSQKNLKFGLIMILIPSRPEAILVECAVDAPQTNWKILESNRERKESFFAFPKTGNPPQNLPCRQELFTPPAHFYDIIESELSQEGLRTKKDELSKFFSHSIQTLESKLQKSLVVEKTAQKEKDWKKLADQLKIALSQNITPEGNTIRFLDYETEQEVELKVDSHLPLPLLVEKFYQNAQKKKRRLEEIASRIKNTTEQLNLFKNLTLQLLEIKHFSELLKISQLAGLSLEKPLSSKNQSLLIGKSFLSKEELKIWVGRDRTENMDLTFKLARGNDLWMHVRGKPGAHVIIQVPPGKTASLETLLDAGHLAIYYSNGENWGKTEVDYTHKKYVKRIKDSTEVNYNNNKTLLIELDQERINRLKINMN